MLVDVGCSLLSRGRNRARKEEGGRRKEEGGRRKFQPNSGKFNLGAYRFPLAQRKPGRLYSRKSGVMRTSCLQNEDIMDATFMREGIKKG